MNTLQPYLNKIRYFLQTSYHKLRHYYRRLNQKQRIVLTLGVGLIVVLLLLISFIPPKEKTSQPSSHATFSMTAHSIHNLAKHNNVITNGINPHGLQQQLTESQKSAAQHYQTVNTKLQTIQSGLGQVASEQSVARLQQTVATPNPVLLTKVNRLQQSVNVIKVQTAKKTFIPAKMVEKYFRLAAVQVFSDGMRAIIDVQGHQTLLSVNEVCPACRGWTLKKMNFANQSAVFENSKQQYVHLQTN